MARLAARAGVADSVALHRWSVTEGAAFWDLVWDDLDLVGERGEGPALDDAGRCFTGARLCLAEHVLAQGPTGPAAATEPAIVEVDEDGTTTTVTWAALRTEVAEVAAALRADGVGIGDRVAAWMPNVASTIVVMLATNALGAVFTSTSPDFGVDAVVDRFGQVAPTVLVAADGYHYAGRTHALGDRLAEVARRLPGLRRVVVVPRLGTGGATGPATDATPGRTDDVTPAEPLPGDVRAVHWADWLAPHRGAAPTVTRVPFDAPGFVLYSSGTTGPPKCIVHRAGGILLKHLLEHRYHCDLRPGDRILYFTTCGWMMWNWLASTLGSGATVVCYDGSPFHPTPNRLFDLVDEHRVTLLGVSAKFLDSCRTAGLRPVETHRLDSLRTLCSTGSPLLEDGFRYVYDAIAPDVHLASISGGTDLCGCFVAGDPTRPVWAGEIQGPVLGMDVDVVDDQGRPCPPDAAGELVCRPTFPTVPLGFWGDEDGSRFHAAYFDRFTGWWAHGDFASWTDHGGMVIHGRSDATLNAGGVRIGTAELYRIVERFDEVAECLAVGQAVGADTRIVLFVRPVEGQHLDADLEARIRTALRTGASPRHVPALIVEAADLPRTRSGKLSELAVADVVNGRPVRNVDALANPESLTLLTLDPPPRN
jgi:acetoacetyl-CoA synthetase